MYNGARIFIYLFCFVLLIIFYIGKKSFARRMLDNFHNDWIKLSFKLLLAQTGACVGICFATSLFEVDSFRFVFGIRIEERWLCRWVICQITVWIGYSIPSSFTSCLFRNWSSSTKPGIWCELISTKRSPIWIDLRLRLFVEIFKTNQIVQHRKEIC